MLDSEKEGSRISKPSAWRNFSSSPTWCTRPTTGCGARATSLWVHRNLFWQLSRDGNLHGSGMSHATTASQGTLEGGRHRGQQRKCWMDSIKEWTSLPMPELLTRASCKKDWKRISTKSFLMSVWWPDLSRDWTELNYWKVDDRSWMCTVTFMHAIKLKESCPHFPFAIIPESDYCQCTPSRSRKNRNMVIHLVKYRIQALATRFI